MKSKIFDYRGIDLLNGIVPHPGYIKINNTSTNIPKYIHQTWKSTEMSEEYASWALSWKQYHPDYLHILWLDNDNDLLAQEFPEYVSIYNNFPLIIEKLDFTRLLYLYKFGGIYADLDYIAYKNVPDTFTEIGDVYINTAYKNPRNFITEVFQNSLMISEPNNNFIKLIIDNITFLENDIYNNTQNSLFNALTNPITSRLFNEILVLNITGPNMIDKSFIINNISNNTSNVIVPLNSEYFSGPISFHVQKSTWGSMSNILYVIYPIILIIMIIIIIMYMIIKRFK